VGVQALAAEGFDVLGAVIEEVHAAGLDVDAILRPIPQPEEVRGLLLDLIALLHNIWRLHIRAIGPLLALGMRLHESVLHLARHDVVQDVVVPLGALTASGTCRGDAQVAVIAEGRRDTLRGQCRQGRMPTAVCLVVHLQFAIARASCGVALLARKSAVDVEDTEACIWCWGW